MKTFDFNNANADALVVPQEEGGSEDDKYFGSIGDATMKHLYSLDHGQRQMYNELIHMSSGTVFRATPSIEQYDPDPFNLRGKDLDKYLKSFRDKGVAESTISTIKEAIEVEVKRREESEDVFDNGTLIPYDDWEKFPQQWAHIEMPSTPKDKFIFMGNTTQSFYDYFPEGHPDSALISSTIGLLDRGDVNIDEKYVKWLKDNVIFSSSAKNYVQHYLGVLADGVAEGVENPNTLAEVCLSNIDRCWGIEYKNTVAATMRKDSLLSIIIRNEKQWEEQAKEGINVYASVKAFGKALFEISREKEDDHLYAGDGSGRIKVYGSKSKVNGFHWARYRKIKKLYAPRVMVRGFDLNRCRIPDLQRALNMDRKEAETVWFKRPFENLGILYRKGYIGSKTFSNDETTDRICVFMENKSNSALKTKDLKKFTEVRHYLMNLQRDKEQSLKPSQWGMLWEYYRLLKSDITQELLNGQKEERKVNV